MKNRVFIPFASTMIFMACFLPSQAQVPENGLVFDGNDDYVSIPSSPGDELNPEFNLTVECWVYLNEAASATHRPHLITKYYSYGLAVETTGVARMFFYTDEWDLISSTTSINPNQWYHLAATFDGNIGRLYVNGREEATTLINDTLNQNIEDVRLGSVNNTAGIDNLNGMIDEVRIWNVTRTQTQIQDNMNRIISGNTSGLVGYWRLDESSGTNADGESPYDNDGTLMNMSTPSAWQTSTASIGETSIFAESADITETSGCAVDVDFLAGTEGPGAGRSLAVMQVNQLPNTVAGLYPDRANRYWEIWSEDPDFDADFTADVRFHYDGIGGLPSETALKLYRRNDATSTWEAVTGYTVVSNDGGSSTTTDGIGYIELTITEATAGGFSGQYIISWTSEPPVVSGIPDQSVPEGSAFATINLDDYVDDPDNADNEITWTVSGEDHVTVTITNRVATITADDPDWNGSDVVTFRAEDPDGGTDSDDVTFGVTPVNDPPVVGNIPGEAVPEGTAFATIDLDDYVSDVEDADADITWTASGQTNLTVDITGRVATITPIDPDWNGSETITFQAEDTEGGTGSDTATFVVTPVNDAPVVSDIPDQEVAEGAPFASINLDDYVEDVDDADVVITWTVSGQSELAVDITDRVATITVNDPEWNGSETITFTAEDPDGEADGDQATFTVTQVNDAPVVSGIPDQTIAEGQSFSPVNLNDFMEDVDDPDSLISWTVSGALNVTVDLADSVASFIINDADWNGADTLVFTASDTSGAEASDTMVLTATPVNDPPVISDIPGESVAEGSAFATIALDDFVEDVDDADNLLHWSVSGGSNLSVDITDRVATITADDPDWNGSDTLAFTVIDQQGAFDMDTGIYTVTAINDAPMVGLPIADVSAEIGQAFSLILDPNTFVDADTGDQLTLSASMMKEGMTPAWITFDPATRTFSGTPADADSGLVEVIVTATDDSSASVADTFYIRVVSYVGISNQLEGLEINLYPNPNNGRFIIESDGTGLKDVVLEIFNEKGQLIWNMELKDEPGSLREPVDLGNASNGLYLLRIRNKNGMINKRFVIGR
jgi:hypothetical protein